MSEPNSRRSFLFGRSARAQDAWSSFVVRLRHACAGPVRLVSTRQAHLKPARLDDVLRAREFCQTFGVLLALDGLPLPQVDQDKPVLWVEAGSNWGSLMPLGDTGLWRVDAGCPCAGLEAAGLLEPALAGAPLNLAQWFARAARHERLADAACMAALVRVDWLLPDGTLEVFGPFGQRDDQPLRSLAAQTLVPQLFQLTTQLSAWPVWSRPHWPMRFHLDALADPEQVNLAHLFIGHGGSLGWLVAATFQKPAAPMPARAPVCWPAFDPQVEDFDQRVKQALDPKGIFLSLADQTG